MIHAGINGTACWAVGTQAGRGLNLAGSPSGTFRYNLWCLKKLAHLYCFTYGNACPSVLGAVKLPLLPPSFVIPIPLIMP
jgi:hypothetical protein